MKLEYLLFNIVILLTSTLGIRFYNKKTFPHGKSALLAILLVCTPYLIWDQFVTDHWWSFNRQYILGVYIGKLPIEEIFFFLSVPWSCLVIWENLKHFSKKKLNFNLEMILVVCSLISIIWAFFHSLPYTLAVSGVMTTILCLSMLTNHWFQKKMSCIYLVIILALTLIFNGYLTSRPVVLYNSIYNSQIKVGTIPVEDIFYGLALISGVTIIYELALAKKRSNGQVP